jgi:hypothetical protein
VRAIIRALSNDIDIERADSHRLPVEGLSSRAGEGVDGGGDVRALEVVDARVGVEDDAGDLLIAQVSLRQGGQVRPAILEEVERSCTLDGVGRGGLEDKPAGAPGSSGGDRDVVQSRRLEVAAADRRRLGVLVVQVGGDVVDLDDAGDGVACCAGWDRERSGGGEQGESGGSVLHFERDDLKSSYLDKTVKVDNDQLVSGKGVVALWF